MRRGDYNARRPGRGDAFAVAGGADFTESDGGQDKDYMQGL